MNKTIIRIMLVSVVGILLSGCGSNTSKTVSNVSKTVKSTGNNNSQPKKISNVILAKAVIPGDVGKQLELVDVRGQYTNNTVIGPFEGNNWSGQFELRLIGSAGKILSKLSLPKKHYTLFMKKFQIHLTDYNGDGYPDFTLGQYGTSNGYFYQLFTIKTKDIYQLHTEPAELFVSKFSYSPLFENVTSNGFKSKYYDNEKTKWFQATYLWKNNEFKRSSLRTILSN